MVELTAIQGPAIAAADLALVMVAELVPSSVVDKRARLASATKERPLAME